MSKTAEDLPEAKTDPAATEAATEIEATVPAVSHEEIERAMTELTALDARLRTEGHTLAELLAVEAKHVFGVDVR